MTVEATGATVALPDRAELVLSDNPIPVSVETEKTADTIAFRFQAYGVTLEEEAYRYGPTEFALVEAAKEQYEPPLPLLRFPMTIGDTWSWTGSMTMFAPHPARAAVTTSRESLDEPGYTDEAIKVTVNLAIESGAETPAKRTLTFWFVPKKGLLKREFGKGLSRVPEAPESAQPEGS